MRPVEGGCVCIGSWATHGQRRNIGLVDTSAGPDEQSRGRIHARGPMHTKKFNPRKLHSFNGYFHVEFDNQLGAGGHALTAAVLTRRACTHTPYCSSCVHPHAVPIDLSTSTLYFNILAPSWFGVVGDPFTQGGAKKLPCAAATTAGGEQRS